MGLSLNRGRNTILLCEKYRSKMTDTSVFHDVGTVPNFDVETVPKNGVGIVPKITWGLCQKANIVNGMVVG